MTPTEPPATVQCATCSADALPGRLLCEVCKGHAQELERIRLNLPARMRTAGAGVAIALALLGCSLTPEQRAKVAADVVSKAPAACLVYQSTAKRTPEADAVCAAIQRPCEGP